MRSVWARMLCCVLLAAIGFGGMSSAGAEFFGELIWNVKGMLLEAQGDREDALFRETVNTFLTALDGNDAEAIRGLFSEHVRETDGDLDAQIARLIELYPGPTDDCYYNGLLQGSYSSQDGQMSSRISNTFPIVSNGAYYWCRMELVYENDADESQIGVAQLLFYTADEYCIFRSAEGARPPEDAGLNVYAEQSLDCEVRCIEGYPCMYTAGAPIDEAEAVAFLEKNSNYADFAKQFGEASAASGLSYYYELTKENGRPQYLDIIVDVRTQEISDASIVDDSQWLKKVWEAEKK